MITASLGRGGELSAHEGLGAAGDTAAWIREEEEVRGESLESCQSAAMRSRTLCT